MIEVDRIGLEKPGDLLLGEQVKISLDKLQCVTSISPFQDTIPLLWESLTRQGIEHHNHLTSMPGCPEDFSHIT